MKSLRWFSELKIEIDMRLVGSMQMMPSVRLLNVEAVRQDCDDMNEEERSSTHLTEHGHEQRCCKTSSGRFDRLRLEE